MRRRARPKSSTGVSPSNTNVGDIDENRRLPGAIDPGRPGRGSYQFIAPFSMKPVPGGITPDGTPSVWVSDTTHAVRIDAGNCRRVARNRHLPAAATVFSPPRIRAAQASA